jgi:alpha-tubulin suppressor-like RCC1 family protein
MEEDEDATEEPAPKKNAKAAKKADSKKEVTKKEAPKKTTNKKEAAPKKPVAKKETAPKKEAGTKKTVTKKASTAVSEEVEEEDEPVEAQPKKTAKAAAPKKVVAKAEDPTRGVKRARTIKDDVNAAKRAKLDESRFVLRDPHIEGVINQGGTVLCVGQGDTGQIGLGPDVMEASKPKVVSSINGSPVVSICAGGMHSLALTKEGVVYSFGCNDDGALGRITEDDDETYTPGILIISVSILNTKSN